MSIVIERPVQLVYSIPTVEHLTFLLSSAPTGYYVVLFLARFAQSAEMKSCDCGTNHDPVRVSVSFRCRDPAAQVGPRLSDSVQSQAFLAHLSHVSAGL